MNEQVLAHDGQQTNAVAAVHPQSRLQRAVEYAARLLPAQGTITAFVHHNTLHAFEDLPFEQAVLKGAETFGCHPYLPEQRYREKLSRGRIRREDLESVLIDDLGDRGDELLGFLGTRFHLRMAMLHYPLRTGPVAELRWVVEESDALRQFREETPAALRDRVVSDTRHWVMRDLRNGNRGQQPKAASRIREIIDGVFESFDDPQSERWKSETWEAFTLHVLWLVCRDGISHAEDPAPVMPKYGSAIGTGCWKQRARTATV